jgi:hypothetical protein
MPPWSAVAVDGVNGIAVTEIASMSSLVVVVPRPSKARPLACQYESASWIVLAST